MSNEALVRDILETAENILETAISNAMGMIQTVAPERAADITKALVEDQLVFAAHRRAIKKTLQ